MRWLRFLYILGFENDRLFTFYHIRRWFSICKIVKYKLDSIIKSVKNHAFSCLHYTFGNN